jgi:hypothetical protein
MLALKLTLVPAFIGALTLAGRRWGPAIGGFLTGLPVVAGPAVFFMAVEQGEAFAAGAARATFTGLVSLTAYCLVYGRVSRRAAWPVSLAAGWGAFIASTAALDRLSIPLSLSLPLVAGTLAAAPKWLPGSRTPEDLPVPPPARDPFPEEAEHREGRCAPLARRPTEAYPLRYGEEGQRRRRGFSGLRCRIRHFLLGRRPRSVITRRPHEAKTSGGMPVSEGMDSWWAAWEIYVRMGAGVAMILTLTGVAHLLGPRLSGLLAPFPVAATVLTVFTHRFQGADAAARFLRSLLAGSFTLALFFLVVALTVERWGTGAAFLSASAAALLLHGLALRFFRPS